MTSSWSFFLQVFPSISFSQLNTVVISLFLAPSSPHLSPNSSFSSTSPFYHLHILVILTDLLLEAPSVSRSFELFSHLPVNPLTHFVFGKCVCVTILETCYFYSAKFLQFKTLNYFLHNFISQTISKTHSFRQSHAWQ